MRILFSCVALLQDSLQQQLQELQESSSKALQEVQQQAQALHLKVQEQELEIYNTTYALHNAQVRLSRAHSEHHRQVQRLHNQQKRRAASDCLLRA